VLVVKRAEVFINWRRVIDFNFENTVRSFSFT
jgi:hypothetical protein